MSIRKWHPRLWESDAIADIQAKGTNDGVLVNDRCWNLDDKTVYYCATATATTSTWTAIGGGGGGDLTEITSTGGTVTITNGTGPIPNLEVAVPVMTNLNAIDISLLTNVEGAWSFDNTSDRLADRSTNANDLTNSGPGPTPLYYYMYGKEWLWREETTTLETSSHDSALEIGGAFTGHQLFMLGATGQEPAAGQYMFGYNQGGASQANNIQYALKTNTAADVHLQSLHEFGSGSNQNADFEARPVPVPALYTMTRSSDGLDYFLYINGKLVSSDSVANAPDITGTNGRFALGLQSDANQSLAGWVGDTVIQSEQMSAADILIVAQQVGVAP